MSTVETKASKAPVRLVDPRHLMGTGDVAARLGVTAGHVNNYVQRRATSLFPEPIVETSAGRLWLREDVEAWIRVHNRKRPTGKGPRRFYETPES